MKFPYGISDFYEIISEGYLYLDRTHMIRTIESAGKSILFLRPRRFGKSLVLSMLENYYDIKKKDQFEQLFGHLKIGQNPTPLKNKFFILRFDFSCIDTNGSLEQIKQSLTDHVNDSINNFILYYKDYLKSEVRINSENALSSISSLLAVIRGHGTSIYLLIDEYDNSANELMLLKKTPSDEEEDIYTQFVKKNGPLKTLFKALKAGSNSCGFSKTFIVGVCPIVMSDITSGYNIAKNKYLEPQFNDFCGFTDAEIKDCLEKIITACKFDSSMSEQAYYLMKTYYNGYKFSVKADQYLYNPTLSLYFMEELQNHCEFPQTLLDTNLAVDEQKIQYVSSLAQGAKVVFDMCEQNATLEISQLSDRFGVKELIEDSSKDKQFIFSYLYYTGVLTILCLTIDRDISLGVPNLVMKSLYVDRIRSMMLTDPETRDNGLLAAKQFYKTCDMEPLCDFIVNHYLKVLSNRDYISANELTIKTAFLTLLYNDIVYVMDSEMEIERKYTDLTMILRPDSRKTSYFDMLIEFKYVSLRDVKLTSDKAKNMSQAALNKLKPIKDKIAEATKQAKAYAKSLNKKYSELRLRTFVVVALGFDRVCWKEIV